MLDAHRRRLAAAIVALAASTLVGCSSDGSADADRPSGDGAAAEADGSAVELRPYELLDLSRPDGSEVTLADPAVVKDGDTWYLYGTTTDEGFEMWSSTDLAEWSYGGYVWKPTPGSWNDNGDQGGYWAPDVRIADNGVWLYYTSQVRIGVARADGPEGPFEDVLDHPLIGNGYGGIGDGVLTDSEETIVGNWDDRAWDALLHETDDGSLILYFSAMTPFSELRAIPMIDESTPAEVEPTVIVPADEDALSSWEGWVREGPSVVEHDGVVHLMYSGNAWSNDCYAVGVATAADPLGPFERRPDNPIIATDAATEFRAPGHNSVAEGPDGELLAFFHVKVDDQIFGPRKPMYAELTVDGDGNLQFVDPPSTEAPDTPLCRQPRL